MKYRLNQLLFEYTEKNAGNYEPVAVGRYGIRKRSDIYKKELSDDYTKNKVIKKDTLIIGMGSVQIDIGVLAEDAFYSVSPAYKTFEINTSIVLSEYLELLFTKKNFVYTQRYMIASARQGKKVDIRGLLGEIVDIPSLDEQNTVVHCIQSIKKIISKNKYGLALLDELIDSRFIEMFSDCKKVKASAYIKELRAGKSLAGTEECQNKVLKTGAATFGHFDPEQYKYLPKDYVPNPLHTVEVGDVIISRMNTPTLVGTCSYVWDVPDNYYYPDRLWKVILFSTAKPIYIWQCMQQPEVRKQIQSVATGTSGTMFNISKPKLLEILIPEATFEKQSVFSEFVSEIEIIKNSFIKRGTLLNEILDKKMSDYFG